MEQYYLVPESETYRKVIFDVIRIFLPRFQWSRQPENGEPISVQCTEQTWTLLVGERRSVFAVAELDENQRRRLLKQEMYRLMAQITGKAAHQS